MFVFCAIFVLFLVFGLPCFFWLVVVSSGCVGWGVLFGADGDGYIVCHYGVGRGARFHTSVNRLLCLGVGAGWGCKRVYVLLSYTLLPTSVRIDLIVRQVGKWGGGLRVYGFLSIIVCMYYHVTPIGNLESIMRFGLVPVIGKRSRACGESIAGVYLFSSREDVDTALMSWLGDEFDDDVDLAVLRVECDSAVRGDVEYEYVCFETIVPECISLDSIE